VNQDDLDSLLRLLVSFGGSDLHLKVGSAPKVRVDGDLRPIEGHEQLEPLDTESIADAILTPLAREQFQTQMDADFAYAASHVGRFRVNVFRQRGSVGIVMRHVSYGVASIEELRLPPVIRSLAEERRGLILVTGPTGSGKTTTLAAMVDHVNQTRNANLVTIEDPIEILHQDRRSSISQREIGTDAASFARAMRAAMRQDPDVIMVGEMRDLETVSAALTAAETGHLVLSSLHTTDATETVNRIVDFYPAGQQQQARVSLAATLRGTVAQRLTSYRQGGRIPVCETMVTTGRIQQCILNMEHTHQIRDIIEEGEFYGMQSFDQALVELVRVNDVSVDEAMAASSKPHDLRVRLERAGILEGGRSGGIGAEELTAQLAALNQHR
jgi:twitching motility protein PilT